LFYNLISLIIFNTQVSYYESVKPAEQEDYESVAYKSVTYVSDTGGQS